MENWKRKVGVFVTSQMISLFGSMLVQYAITWYITLETKSGVYTTLAILCGFLPVFVLSPLAGVWADRYNRKRLIMISDGAIALTTLVVAIIFLMGYREIWVLLVALAIRGGGSAIQTPVVTALLPDITPSDELERVNGLLQSVQSLTSLICPAISGALLTMASMESIFFIDVITAIIAIAFMGKFLVIPAVVVKEKAAGAWSEWKVGLQYCYRVTYLKELILCCMLLWIIVGPLMYLPPLHVIRLFGDQVWYLSAVEMASGIGMLIGGILISIFGGFKNRVYTMSLSLVFMSISVLLLSSVNIFWGYLGCLAIGCVCVSIFNTVAITLLQVVVDKKYIGRVFGIVSMFSSSLMPLGMLFFGPLADRIDIGIIFTICGIVVFISAIGLLCSKSLKRVGNKTTTKRA